VLCKILKSDGDRDALVLIVCVNVNCADKRSIVLFFGSEQLCIAATTSGFDDAVVGSSVTLTEESGLPVTVGMDDCGLRDGLLEGLLIGFTDGKWLRNEAPVWEYEGSEDGSNEGSKVGAIDGETEGLHEGR